MSLAEDVYKRQEQYDKAIKEGVQNNITNPVGVFLFKQTFYNNSTAENEALLQQIPAKMCIRDRYNGCHDEGAFQFSGRNRRCSYRHRAVSYTHLPSFASSPYLPQRKKDQY